MASVENKNFYFQHDGAEAHYAVIVREYNNSKGYKYNYNGEACDYTLRDSTQLDEYRAKAHLTFFKIVNDTLNMMHPSVNAIVVDYAVNPTHRKFMKS